MNDRTVHASNRTAELVRYDRAGRWYVEPRDQVGDFSAASPRLQKTLRGAAEWALTEAMCVYKNQPGGSAFDRLVARLSGGGEGTGAA